MPDTTGGFDLNPPHDHEDLIEVYHVPPVLVTTKSGDTFEFAADSWGIEMPLFIGERDNGNKIVIPFENIEFYEVSGA